MLIWYRRSSDTVRLVCLWTRPGRVVSFSIKHWC